MIKKRQKLFLGFLIGCIALGAAALVKTNSSADNTEYISVAAEALENPNGGLQAYYIYGTELTIPQNSIVWQGSEYSTTTFVTFPDGRTYENNNIVLNQTGMYQVEYRATVGKYCVYANTSFQVENSLYTLNEIDSSVYYGTHRQYTDVPTGAVAQIAKGDTFKFNGVIDFNERTKNDSFVSWIFTPNAIGSEDVTRLIFRLTDVYNENNYVEIFCKQSPEDLNRNTACYWTAGAAGQSQIGLYWRDPSRTDLYLSPLDNNRYVVYENCQWGMGYGWSMTGTPEKCSLEEQVLSLTLDYSTKAVYVNGLLVHDLDDTELTNNPWKGFTNGQAYLSVYSKNYSASSLGLVFTDIGGYDLSMTTYPDKERPELSVNYGAYMEENLPQAVVGEGYAIFDASAYDLVDGNVDVTVGVYYNYGTANSVRYSITDGKFVPTLEGGYSIVYKAKDRSGNLAEKIVRVYATNCGEIECEIGTLNENVYAGNVVQLFERLDFKNTIGYTNVKITAVPQNDPSWVYEIDVKNYTFRPLHAGAYVLNIETSDYVRTERFTYDFSVQVSNTSVFEKYEIDLPDYLLKDMTYEIPSLSAFALDSGKPVETDADIYITEADSTLCEIADGKFAPKVSGKAKISYVLKNGETFERDFNVVDTKYGEDKIDFSGYIQSTQGRIDKALTTDYMEIKTNAFKAKDGAVAFEFINRLRHDIFVVSLGANSEALNFNAFSVLLNDEIKFTYRKNDDGTLTFIINDKDEHKTSLNFAEYMQSFEINYTNKTQTIKLNTDSDKAWKVNETLLGEDFEGFTCEGIYVKFIIEDIKGETELHLYSINSVPFYEEEYDLIAPDIVFERISGDYNIGDRVEIRPAYAFDVFSPSVTAWIKVTAPDKSVVQLGNVASSDMVVADQAYSITLTQYGKYVVSFKATDIYGNTATYSYNINVIDSEAPTVSLKEPVTVAKNSFIIADIEISDNLSETFTTYVNVTNPDGSLQKTAIGEKYTASQAGTYMVTYCVFDEENNMTMISYQVVVK